MVGICPGGISHGGKLTSGICPGVFVLIPVYIYQIRSDDLVVASPPQRNSQHLSSYVFAFGVFQVFSHWVVILHNVLFYFYCVCVKINEVNMR